MAEGGKFGYVEASRCLRVTQARQFLLPALPALLFHALDLHTRHASVCFYPPSGGFFYRWPWPEDPEDSAWLDQVRLNGGISRILSQD